MASGNMKEIKRRIKSVESTKQITNAMQLVASSKLRKAKNKADKARPFFNALYDTMHLIQSEDENFFSEFISKRKEVKTIVLIVISGDRGLAGGFNSNIFKLAQARIDELKELGAAVKIVAMGKKSVEYFSKRGYDLVSSHTVVGESLSLEQSAEIAESLVTSYVSAEIDGIEVFYTMYVSPIAQQPERKAILPLEFSEKSEDTDTANTEGQRKYKIMPIYEPSAKEVFEGIVPKYLTGVIYCAVADSFAAEQAARRMAMENATDNADEMISELSLRYNRARQASITQEINEIVGGAAGL